MKKLDILQSVVEEPRNYEEARHSTIRSRGATAISKDSETLGLGGIKVKAAREVGADLPWR